MSAKLGQEERPFGLLIVDLALCSPCFSYSFMDIIVMDSAPEWSLFYLTDRFQKILYCWKTLRTLVQRTFYRVKHSITFPQDKLTSIALVNVFQMTHIYPG